MKSAVLLPYCPWPSDTGGKVEMLKQLGILKTLGDCSILSASTKPVGRGWSDEKRSIAERDGYSVFLREDECGRNTAQLAGIGYAAVCKALGLEKAFGHSNSYHHYAFPVQWWKRRTEGSDVAVINYSYWAWLPCSCPKVVVLLDMWSDYMWEGPTKEVEDLETADLVIVISKEEEKKLNDRGVKKTLWSPPAVKYMDLPLTSSIGCVGSANKFNIEGLRWLENACPDVSVRIYGSLSEHVKCQNFIRAGRYADTMDPYRECGIIILPKGHGMGVQIKAIEALASGRAIVARKGSMCGLPEGGGAWIEVERHEEMVEAALYMKTDSAARHRQAEAAKEYYRKYLDYDGIINMARNAYLGLAGIRK